MSIPTTFIIYLICFRLAIITAGIVSIVLGYRLFCKGVDWNASSGNGTEVSAEVGGHKFTLKNAAPGTCFGLFGVLIISIMFASGGPELTLGYVKEAANTASGVTDSTLFSNLTLKMRGNTADSILSFNATGRFYEDKNDTVNAIAAYEQAVSFLPADPLNNLAWMYLHTGKTKAALPLAQLAVKLAPDNANYLDTYAEVLFKTNNYSRALRFLEKAVALDDRLRPKLSRFRRQVVK